jgi:CRISPR-associated protein Csb1
MNLDTLTNHPRLLIRADLRPVQGSRFQPTGFPDLGAAEYPAPSGEGRMLLVESAQSMANRLEAVCWDEAAGDLVAPLAGLPYVKAVLPDGTVTCSVLEAHRLNSPYIYNSKEFDASIGADIGFEANKPFDRGKLARALLKYDPNSLLHGVFLEKVGGTVRLPRALSAFIEAENVQVAPSGGVKVDRVQPGTGENTTYGKANEGYGNVPYHRDEFTAERITAYFNLDLALLRGLGLGREAEDLLVTLALYKIQRFFDEGLRLRTACDLDLVEVAATRPEGFPLPATAELAEALPGLIEAVSPAFVPERPFVVHFTKKGK